MINRAEQRIENRVPKTINHLDREMNALKTRQLLGGDNIKVQRSNVATAAIEIAAGNPHAVLVYLTPTSSANIPLAQLAFSVYYGNPGDPNVDNNPDYLWPSGSFFADPDKMEILEVSQHYDYIGSSDATGQRRHIIVLRNTAALGTNTFYIHVTFYYPKLATS